MQTFAPVFAEVPAIRLSPVTPQLQLNKTVLVQVLAALAVMGLILVAYHGIELNGFHYDDWPNILNHTPVQMAEFSLDGLALATQHSFLPRRPLASLTFAIDWWRGQGDPAPFLVTNLVIHVLTAWATMALILRIVVGFSNRPASRQQILAAGVAATWWALQPIQVQAVSYAVQRMTELATLFSVLCVWAYLNARRDDRRWQLWGGVSIVCFALGALSKEIAWITPALVVMAEFLIVRNDQPLARSALDRLILASPLAILVAALVDVLVDGPLSHWALRGYPDRDFTLIERVLTQPKVLIFHVSQILWPMPDRFSLEHDVEIVRTAASWEFWLPMSAIVAWCAIGLRMSLVTGRRAIGFFILWLPATLLLESSFVPLQMIFEHRMYFPTIGFAGLIGLGLAHVPIRPRTFSVAAWAAVALATLFAMWSTSQRVPQWRNELTVYQQAVKHAPRSVGAWNQLALSYLEVGQRELALQAIDRAIAIEPRWGDGYPFVNRGVILEAMGKIDQARRIYDQTIELFPQQVLGFNNRGLLFLRSRALQPAIQDFDHAIEVAPDYAPAWTNRGTAHLLGGDMERAQRDLEKAVSISPRESIAHHYLAQIYARAGSFSQAAQARRAACHLGVAADCGTNPIPSKN